MSTEANGAQISAPLCKGSWQAVGLTEGLYWRPVKAFTLNLLLHFLRRGKSVACGGAASAPSEEGAGAPKEYKGATEGEITRGCYLHQGADEHRTKKRSFAFALVYIKCFRTYSLYLSLRLPAQILYAVIHLPPQREARALPRRARNLQRCKPRLSPPEAGCPHPSRRGAAPHRATFPKGKAKRSVSLVEHRGDEKCA